MPDKPLTVATYAAGASLAAITLVYVFGPTFFLDGENQNATGKRGVVGLSNPANDCFINSVLQALAGLPDLRIYLIREVHRRQLDGPEVYRITDEDEKDLPETRATEAKLYKLKGLRDGIVTVALKLILDSLNERPIYRKTISAGGFVLALEKAFQTRISRQQQDAQELLQVVTERLCDEYHAGAMARKRALKTDQDLFTSPIELGKIEAPASLSVREQASLAEKVEEALIHKQESKPEEGFPFEGKLESQIECLTCRFMPKPSTSSFVTLTLNVPQQSTTTLEACFDGLLKVETIDGFRCDYCRLVHAIDAKKSRLAAAKDLDSVQGLRSDIDALQQALENDPENPPKGVQLPDSKLAPERRIQRHTRISTFPKILPVHLSRSLYSQTSLSTKITAKVSFPENLPLGGLLPDQWRNYRLAATVTHKGGHNSGHYESFRRQVTGTGEPYSTPNSFGTEGVYSRPSSKPESPVPSAMQSPRLPSDEQRRGSTRVEQISQERLTSARATATKPAIATTVTPSSISSRSSVSLSGSALQQRSSSVAPGTVGSDVTAASPIPSVAASKRREPTPSERPSTDTSMGGAVAATKNASTAELSRVKTRAKQRRDNRWWRISDDKVKEARTSEVLGMQKEVYLLFYELDQREHAEGGCSS